MRSSKQLVWGYLIVSSLWIAFSDSLLFALFGNASALTHISLLKGMFFVGISTLLLYWLVGRQVRDTLVYETALRNTVNVLQDSVDTYRYLFINNPQPMWIYDLETLHFLEVNDAAIEVYGYTYAEFLKMTIKDIRPQREYQRLLDNIARGREKPFQKSGEWQHLLKDGTEITVEVLSHEVDFNGKRSALVVAYDITDRKRLEAERLENERLRVSLEAESQLRVWRDRFFNVIAHEVRTPLAVIASSVSLMQKYYEKLTLERKLDHLEKIQRQVTRIVELTDDMSVMLRTHEATTAYHEEKIDLIGLCQAIIHEAKDWLSSNQTCRLVCQDRYLLIHGDKRLLARAIENLIKNAIKYSPEGGEIALILSKDAYQNAIIRVEDEGIGIPAEDMPHIFEEFKRARNVGKIEGTGLGLSIARQAIELHRGTIQAHSRTPRGTTFFVQLPLLLINHTPQP